MDIWIVSLSLLLILAIVIIVLLMTGVFSVSSCPQQAKNIIPQTCDALVINNQPCRSAANCNSTKCEKPNWYSESEYTKLQGDCISKTDTAKLKAACVAKNFVDGSSDDGKKTICNGLDLSSDKLGLQFLCDKCPIGYRTVLNPGDQVDITKGLFSTKQIHVGTLMFTITAQGFVVIMKYQDKPDISWIEGQKLSDNMNLQAVRAYGRWTIVNWPYYYYRNGDIFNSPISTDPIEYIRLTQDGKLIYKVNGFRTWLIGNPLYTEDVSGCNGEYYYPGTLSSDIITSVTVEYNGGGEIPPTNYYLKAIVKDNPIPKILNLMPWACANNYTPVKYQGT